MDDMNKKVAELTESLGAIIDLARSLYLLSIGAGFREDQAMDIVKGFLGDIIIKMPLMMKQCGSDN